MTTLFASLLHKPDILFLDEPTIGLDAVSKFAIREFMLELNRERNVTVILTTHDMDDIETLCERVVLIAEGTVLHDGSLSSLRQRVNPERRVKVELAHPAELMIEHAKTISVEGTVHNLSFDPRQTNIKQLIDEIGQHAEIRDLLVENPPIEELIATLYKGEQ